MNPSAKKTVVEVDSADMTVFEEVVETAIGDGSSPFTQLGLITIIIAGILLIIQKTRPSNKSVWEEDAPVIEAPLSAPTFDEFGQENTGETPPIPEEGLPPGWTEEQWKYYGHQYLTMNETQSGQDEM